MTKMVANNAIAGDMPDWNLNDVADGTITKHTSTELDVTGASGDRYVFSGTGFTYSNTGVTGGTLTGLTISDGGGVELSLTGMNVSAKAIYDDIAAGDLTAAQELIFGGKDSITGSSSDDDLLGYGGNDTINGGKGDDQIDGGAGADKLTGGAGNDSFVYHAVSDSTGPKYDTITDYNGNQDDLSLWFTPSGSDKEVTKGTLSTADFNNDLAKDVGKSALSSHHVVEFVASKGNLKGDIFLIVDCNGKAGYQANKDLVIHFINPSHLSTTDILHHDHSAG